MLVELLRQMAISPRALLRAKEARYAELGLDDPALSDEVLIDAMISNPVLMNRPVVVTPKGVRLCRPAETVQSCYRRAAQMHMVFHSAKQSKISMSDPSLRQECSKK